MIEDSTEVLRMIGISNGCCLLRLFFWMELVAALTEMRSNDEHFRICWQKMDKQIRTTYMYLYTAT